MAKDSPPFREEMEIENFGLHKNMNETLVLE
jgi:hypothetical protein